MPGWRRSAAAFALVALSVAWYASAWSTTGQRVEDFARLDDLTRSADVLARVAAWWAAICSDALRMKAIVVALQIGCVAAGTAAAWFRTRSTLASAVVGAIALSSPFPGSWLDRPIGGADAMTAIAMIAVIGAAAGSNRRSAVMQCAGAFLAVIFSGWPALALLAFALVMRGGVGARVALAITTALAARLAIGFPLDRVLGSLDAADPHGVAILRLIVLAAFAIPAVVYIVTLPRVAPYVRLAGATAGRTPFADVTTATVLIAVAAFVRPGAEAAVYVAELAVVIAAASLVRHAPGMTPRRAAMGLAALLVVLGFAARVSHRPVDDAARVANDRRVVQSAALAGSFTIVQDGNSPHYSPSVLAYYAGRSVRTEYASSIPTSVTGPVLVAYAAGLNRIDESVHAVQAAAEARKRMSFDLYAHRGEGTINDRTHQDTPSGQGVIPTLPLPGPLGEVPSITVTAPFSYTFDRVPVAPGSRLVYVAAKVFPIGDKVRATVRIDVAGGGRTQVDDDLPPAPPAGPLSWQLRSIPIPATRPTTARIIFGATAASGKNIGDWAAFGAPVIVAR